MSVSAGGLLAELASLARPLCAPVRVLAAAGQLRVVAEPAGRGEPADARLAAAALGRHRLPTPARQTL